MFSVRFDKNPVWCRVWDDNEGGQSHKGRRGVGEGLVECWDGDEAGEDGSEGCGGGEDPEGEGEDEWAETDAGDDLAGEP